jgi:N6-L-threonylcarbamoyladenine synthase
MNILTLETTCDETAAAVVTDRLAVLGSAIASQELLHVPFGGVVPEIASRAHVEHILPVIKAALRQAGLEPGQLDAVAIANSPGLAGCLLVGLAAAKALATALGIPLIAVNHLQAHIYACRMAAGEDVFPCVGMIVSGGHTSLYRCLGPLDFKRLGGTIDDAAGEAFDKVAALLGLPYPGGPAIEAAARGGNPRAFSFPRAFWHDPDRLDFSFSGLKTAVRYLLNPPEKTQRKVSAKASVATGEEGPHRGARDAPSSGSSLAITEHKLADVAASFQAAVVDCLVAKALAAVERTGVCRLCVGGGVAANRVLAERLAAECASRGIALHIPPPALCTDNAVMGAIAVERLKAGKIARLDLDVFPTVPPDEDFAAEGTTPLAYSAP